MQRKHYWHKELSIRSPRGPRWKRSNRHAESFPIPGTLANAGRLSIGQDGNKPMVDTHSALRLTLLKAMSDWSAIHRWQSMLQL